MTDSILYSEKSFADCGHAAGLRVATLLRSPESRLCVLLIVWLSPEGEPLRANAVAGWASPWPYPGTELLGRPASFFIAIKSSNEGDHGDHRG